jgi:micrococcal nuclease
MAAGGIAFASSDSTTAAVVTKVVDGDTIDVSYGGDTHRVRLLNVDTPESVDPEEPVECLGPEATRFLRDRLPLGTQVLLAYDEERYDRYDRELAGVFLRDSLINAEIARAGLGVAMSVGVNTRFYSEVQAAQEEARAAERGLYSEEVTCTVPAQVAELESTADTVTSEPPVKGAGLEPIDSFAADLTEVAIAASTLMRLLDGDLRAFPLIAFTSDEISGLSSRATTVETQISAARTRNQATRTAEKARLDAAEEAARLAAEEAARLAAEESARLAAEEVARQAAEAQRRRAPSAGGSASSGSGSSESSSSSAGSGTSSGGSGSSSGSYDGYTGCRAYGAGGTSVDEKGRRYTKIDCTTKQPIG